MTKDQYGSLFIAHKIDFKGAGFLIELINAIQDNIEEFQILKPTNVDAHFPSFLKSRLERYSAFFERTLRPIIASIPLENKSGTIDKNASTFIKKLSEALDKSVNLYYLGNTYGASSTLAEILDFLFTGSDRLSKELFFITTIKPGMDFFRARTIDIAPRTKDEMFHIPFDKRQFASTNRYSIPGVPALYVSTDPYTCFVELDKPDVKTLNYSLLKNVKTVNVLKLQRAEEEMYSILSINRKLVESNHLLDNAVLAKYLVEYLEIFPLIISCTIKVLNPKATFKPEYIIPQLLLQYLRNSDKIDGIMYPSSKLQYPEGGFGFQEVFYNYVFPVKSNCEVGYCPELINQFSITEPTSLEMEGERDRPQFKLLEELYKIVNALEKRPLFQLSNSQKESTK
jgi:hypothetical protein